jgi:hypothetical protein
LRLSIQKIPLSKRIQFCKIYNIIKSAERTMMIEMRWSNAYKRGDIV